MLAALRDETADPEETKEEALDDLHTLQTTGSALLGEAVYSLIEIRKAIRNIEATIKALAK